MPISQTEDYFKSPGTYGPSVSFKVLNLQEEAFSCVKTKTNPNFGVNLAEMLKETMAYFCLFDESHFSNICTL